MPDGLGRTELAEATPGKAAADREGERAPFPDERRGDTEHDSDDRPGVGAGEKPGQKRSRQRQIGGVVVEEQPPDDPAVSGSPRLAANTSRSGQSRFSVRRMRRNHGNRTSIVASTAPTASFAMRV